LTGAIEAELDNVLMGLHASRGKRGVDGEAECRVALPHLFAQPMLWTVSAAAPSMVLGHLRERFGSLLPVILLHAYYNAGFALSAWLAQH
jgi:Type II CAAX prenyl endopeptidase Rce1-like